MKFPITDFFSKCDQIRSLRSDRIGGDSKKHFPCTPKGDYMETFIAGRTFNLVYRVEKKRN